MFQTALNAFTVVRRYRNPKSETITPRVVNATNVYEAGIIAIVTNAKIRARRAT